MKKDKITLTYIFVTVLAFAVILVYFANLDFHSMNDNIGKEGKEVLNRGKHYSDKLYTMVSSEWQEFNAEEESNSSSIEAKALNHDRNINKINMKTTHTSLDTTVKGSSKLKFSTTKRQINKIVKVQNLNAKQLNVNSSRVSSSLKGNLIPDSKSGQKELN